MHFMYFMLIKGGFKEPLCIFAILGAFMYFMLLKEALRSFYAFYAIRRLLCYKYHSAAC